MEFLERFFQLNAAGGKALSFLAHALPFFTKVLPSTICAVHLSKSKERPSVKPLLWQRDCSERVHERTTSSIAGVSREDKLVRRFSVSTP